MLAKVLLWWPAATTISGIIIAAAGTVSLSLSLLILCLMVATWTPTLRGLWSVVDPTADWTYIDKSGSGKNSSTAAASHSPAEQFIYIWPSVAGVAARATCLSASRRPIDLCITDQEVERAIAAGHSAATEWRPTLGRFVVGVPLIPVFVSGDVVPTWTDTWAAMQQPTPKCRITYAQPLKLTFREAKRADAIWISHMDLMLKQSTQKSH
jgi:hypothetical protein